MICWSMFCLLEIIRKFPLILTECNPFFIFYVYPILLEVLEDFDPQLFKDLLHILFLFLCYIPWEKNIVKFNQVNKKIRRDSFSITHKSECIDLEELCIVKITVLNMSSHCFTRNNSFLITVSYSDISQDRFLAIYVGFGLATVLQVMKYGEFNRVT